MSLTPLLLFLLHFCVATTFFVSGLLINTAQCLLYVSLQPVSPKLFKWINYYLHYSICAQILFVAEWWSGSDCRLHVSDEDRRHLGREHAVLIMNHTYEIDWLMGWIIAERHQLLGAAKVYLKDMLRYVPVVGWSWSFSNLVFLRRNWRDDKDHVDQQLDILGEYPYPVWLLIFCEGTRFTVDKHRVSMQVARDKGLPQLRHLLLPRHRGFTHTVSRLRHKFAAIYDLTVEFDTKNYAQPTLTNMIWRRPIRGDIHVRRIPMCDLPWTCPADKAESETDTTATTTATTGDRQQSDGEEQALIGFLYRLYQHKDALMAAYRTNSAHIEPGRADRDPAIYENVWRTADAATAEPEGGAAGGATRAHYLPRRRYSLLNTCAWSCLVLPLLARLVLSLVHGQGGGTLGYTGTALLGALFVLLSWFGLRKMVNLTQISRSSSYGQNTSARQC